MKNRRKTLRKKQMGGLLGRYSDERGDYEGELYRSRINGVTKCQGVGKMKYKNGDVFFGLWHLDKRNGNGTMRYSNGDVYEGHWVDDKRNGQGKMTYSNGEVYEGEWHNDEPYRQQGISNTREGDNSNTIELNISNAKYVECLGKTASEPIEGEVEVGKFINEDEGNLVFKLTESFFAINKEQMRPIYENNDETVYCCKEIGTSIVPRRENVDMDNPYFNMNKIGVISGIVKRDYITKILDDTTNQLYELVRTEQKCVASTTGQMLGTNPNAVSADHCQAKSDKAIYEIQIIKKETTGTLDSSLPPPPPSLDSSLPPPPLTIGGKKYKKSSRKNKTKKNKNKKNRTKKNKNYKPK